MDGFVQPDDVSKHQESLSCSQQDCACALLKVKRRDQIVLLMCCSQDEDKAGAFLTAHIVVEADGINTNIRSSC